MMFKNIEHDKDVNEMLNSWESQISPHEKRKILLRQLESYDPKTKFDKFFHEYERDIDKFVYCDHDNYYDEEFCIKVFNYFAEVFELCIDTNKLKDYHIDALINSEKLKVSKWIHILKNEKMLSLNSGILRNLINYHIDEFDIWIHLIQVTKDNQSAFYISNFGNNLEISKNDNVVIQSKNKRHVIDTILNNNFEKWFCKESFIYDNSACFSLSNSYFKKFLIWFDPDKFIYTSLTCLNLCKKCSEYFDIWYNPDKFTWGYASSYLIQFCDNHKHKWQDDMLFKLINKGS